jgi:major membrane immunogen (membrane-anchored lipoprotein)
MKKNLLSVLLSSIVLLFSCTKEKVSSNELTVNNSSKDGAIYGRIDPEPGDCALTPFGLLGLQNGTFTINSSRNLIANVGYSKGVTSNTNQKIDNFTGGAYVHSQVSSFVYTAATYQPTDGIFRNNAATDAILDQANANAIAASALYASFSPHVVLGNVTSNQTVTSVTTNTVVQITSLNYNSNVLNLTGTAGADNGFIINVSGNFDFSQSEIRLTNVRPERVIFNFPNASAITINKAANIFNGTVLAPVGSVIYHNPAVFNGAIIAKNIAVHSDFNLTQKPFCIGN